MREGSGAFQHGHTYLAHPMACAAALAVQQIIREDNLLNEVNARGLELRDALVRLLSDHPHVGQIRGRGLFWAVELVADRATRTPFDPASNLHGRIKRAALQRGLACYPSGGTIDGIRGDHVLVAPPYIISSGEIETLIDRLCRSIEDGIGSL